MHPIKTILVAIKDLDARTLPALRKADRLDGADPAAETTKPHSAIGQAS